jgi:hypothetical protein
MTSASIGPVSTVVDSLGASAVLASAGGVVSGVASGVTSALGPSVVVLSGVASGAPPSPLHFESHIAALTHMASPVASAIPTEPAAPNSVGHFVWAQAVAFKISGSLQLFLLAQSTRFLHLGSAKQVTACCAQLVQMQVSEQLEPESAVDEQIAW